MSDREEKQTKTFIMIKPDGVERGLMGQVIARFEKKGLQLQRVRLAHAARGLVELHYREHSGKPFFKQLVDSIAGKNVLCMVWAGPSDIVAQARTLIGDSKIERRLPGTIRHDFACGFRDNVIHGSDCEEAVAWETSVWFDSPAAPMIGE